LIFETKLQADTVNKYVG